MNDKVKAQRMLTLKTEQEEQNESRGARTVLRERKGEILLRDSIMPKITSTVNID